MAERPETRTQRRLDACWDALARPHSGRTLLRQIDGLRFLAILGTIVTHVATFLSKHAAPATAALVPHDLTCQLMDAGCVGVQLFFAISGFILALPFAAAFRSSTAAPQLKQFYWRRVTRIEPPYLLNLMLFYGILVLVRGVPAEELLPHLLASGLYVHNIAYGAASLVNGVAWSLEVEIQFYLLAPLVAQVFRIPSAALRRLLLGTAITAIALLGPAYGTFWDLTLLGQFEHFLVGFLIADLATAGKSLAPERSRGAFDLLGTASIAGLMLTSWLAGPQCPLVPVLILGTFAGAFRGPRLRLALSSRPVSTLGGMCYTTYLYHYWLLSVLGWGILRFVPLPESVALQAAILTAVVLPGVLVPCAGLFVLIEKPFMHSDWPSKLLGGWREKRESQPPIPAATFEHGEIGQAA